MKLTIKDLIKKCTESFKHTNHFKATDLMDDNNKAEYLYERADDIRKG